MTEPHLRIDIFWSAKEKCWIADVPDLRPCSAHGFTRSEAFRTVGNAIQGWIETTRERDMDIPDLSCRPEIYAA